MVSGVKGPGSRIGDVTAADGLLMIAQVIGPPSPRGISLKNRIAGRYSYLVGSSTVAVPS
jgi:hypothetical protein